MVLALPQTEVSSLVSSLVGEGAFSVFDIGNPSIFVNIDEFDSMTINGSNEVQVLNDLSGNDNHFRQNTAASRPIYDDTTYDFPVLSFQSKEMLNDTTFSSTTEETLFMICAINAADSTTDFALGSSGSNWGLLYENTIPNLATYVSTGSAAGSTGLPDMVDINMGNIKVIRMRRSDTRNQIEMWENGLLMGVDTLTSGTTDIRMEIGGRGSLRINDMDFARLVYYPEWIDDDDCTRLENAWMQEKLIAPYPAWAANDNDFVKRYAAGQNITDPSSMNGTVYYYDYIGDSTCIGFADKANFESKYIKLYDNAYIYDWNVDSDWEAYDNRNAASRNDFGGSQAEAGMDAALNYELQAEYAEDIYVLKYGASGSHLAVTGGDGGSNWNVADRNNSANNYCNRLRRYKFRAVEEAVLEDGLRVIELGLVSFLGTNDANNSTEADAVESNYTALIKYYRDFPGFTAERVALCQVFSTSGTYTEIETVRTAIANIAANDTNVYLADSMNYQDDTKDNTHPAAITYEYLAKIITQIFVDGSNTFTPSLLPRVTIWLDASDASTITESDNDVTAFTDKISNVDFSTSTLISPKYGRDEDIINSVPALYIPHDSNLNGAVVIDMDNTEVMWLQKGDTDTAFVGNFLIYNADVSDRLGAGALTADGMPYYFLWEGGAPAEVSIIGDDAVWDNNVHIVNMNTDGNTTLTIQVDDNAAQTGTYVNAPGASVGMLWGYIGSGTAHGYLGESVLLSSKINPSAREDMYNYLADKWT